MSVLDKVVHLLADFAPNLRLAVVSFAVLPFV